MENNFTYRTNEINFNNFVAKASNKEINEWVIFNKNTIINKVKNIIVIKDNRVKGKAFLGIPIKQPKDEIWNF